MQKYNVLVLTDHTNHSSENSLYALLNNMYQHELTNNIDVLSKGNADNIDFFDCKSGAQIFASVVDGDFKYYDDARKVSNNLRAVDPETYDLIWLRMPPPLSKNFLDFIQDYFKNKLIINNPNSIYETGSKEFLTNFKQICPPIKSCQTIADIAAFKKEFPIVLKPFRAYGGQGIVKIDGDRVWEGNKESTFDEFIASLEESNIEYLGVKFLKNVSAGDKRIVVVNGKILGASLRLPPKDSWICNVAMGGSSNLSDVDEDEINIINAINPRLTKMGIVMYGVDTLVGDDGRRVLSEINTTSIGGLPQIAQQTNLPLVAEAIDLIWKYFLKNKKNA